MFLMAFVEIKRQKRFSNNSGMYFGIIRRNMLNLYLTST